MGKALSDKRLLFIREYLVDQNATRAAKAAGYSERSAHAQGHDLLKIPEIAAEIQAGLAAQRKDAEERAKKRGITKERWLKELELIGFANMDDFIRIEGDRVIILEKDERKKKSLGRVIKKLKKNFSIKTESFPSGKEVSSESGTQEIELLPKIPALELIGRHFGWVKGQLEISGPGGGPIPTSAEPMTAEERAARLKALREEQALLTGGLVLDRDKGEGNADGD